MAAYADLASLLNNIELMMAHPRFSTSVNKKQIQTLHEKADDLLKFIITNKYGVDTEEAEDLERQISSAARVAEEVIESHFVDQIEAASNQPSHEGSFNLQQIFEACLGCFISSPPSLFDLQQIIEGMDAMMEKAAEVGEKWRPTHHDVEAPEEKAAEKQPLIMGEISPVGLEDDVLKLVDELLRHPPKRQLISIVGMGGTGKTTLARNVYDNFLIKEKFHVRAWATVSQQYTAREILSQLLSCLGKRSGNEKSGDDLGVELYQALFGRKYFIILDDIWSVEPWNDVRQFFPDTGNGSRVVLTTRLSDVARDCLSHFCFTMNLLDEDRSWKLLCRKAFQQENCPYPELEEVGKKISSMCKGLALSIVVIGGLLLNSSTTVGFWEGVARNIKLANAKEKQESLDVLSLSYNHLPPHLKPCFLYMGVFKEDSTTRVSKIIRLWVSEGFIRPNRAQALEEIAEGYLIDLVSRNLILVDKFRQDGRIGSCSIHDLLRDLCLNLARQQDFFNLMDPGNRGTERRLVCEGYQSKIGPPLARSIMGRDKHGQPIRYKFLRVLDDDFHKSREDVLRNVNLRYLAYQNPNGKMTVRKLPTSLSLIWNLQTLIITECITIMMFVAPIEIWKMRQLRHVICPQIIVPSPPRSSKQGDMANLQTLTTLINFRWSKDVCKLIPNIKKLHLRYDDGSVGYDGSLIEHLRYLGRFERLESLEMAIMTRSATPDPKMNKKLAFPTSLRKLSLEFCELHWDDLTMIGSLPHLQVLNLGSCSVTQGEKWSPVPGQFLRLKLLRIHSYSLVCWDADDSHFPVLEKLVLGNLRNLKEIPLGIGDLPKLGLIRLESCSNLSLPISAMRIKEYQSEDLGIDGLQIEFKLYRFNEDRFRERVEAEGLNINDIQLLIH